MNRRGWKTPIFIGMVLALMPIAPFWAEETTEQKAVWSDFQQKAAAWRALPQKPPLSEEVRRERVLAENAVREKDLNRALDHYEAGLKLNPVWPEGHFNAALLYGERREYDKAVWHMHAYLELLPNALDAQQARDQISVWQDDSLRADLATKLMWTKSDNGGDIDWDGAQGYCQNLRLGGYSDWRLPTIEELQAIYDPATSVPNPRCSETPSRIRNGITLSTCGTVTGVWSSSPSNSTSHHPYSFDFRGPNPGRFYTSPGHSHNHRALCVRPSSK